MLGVLGLWWLLCFPWLEGYHQLISNGPGSVDTFWKTTLCHLDFQLSFFQLRKDYSKMFEFPHQGWISVYHPWSPLQILTYFKDFGNQSHEICWCLIKPKGSFFKFSLSKRGCKSYFWHWIFGQSNMMIALSHYNSREDLCTFQFSKWLINFW